jgi:phenylacetate-CoA ligase
MRFDFSSLPLRNRAFSQKAMTFIDQEAKTFLSAILDLAAIETGNRIAREFWQQRQLQNLLTHAAERSPIWRRRIGATKISGIRLTDLPVQTRADVIEQVAKEGALVPLVGPGAAIKHSTSGSSGTPVEFFVTEKSLLINHIRSICQYFLDNVDLSLNLTRVRPQRITTPQGFTVEKHDSWIGPLASLVRTGIFKYIEYLHADMKALCRELERDRLGYVVAQPRFLETVLQHAGPEFFKSAGAAVIVPIAEAADLAMRDAFASVGIPVRANYSSEEVGPIAYECDRSPGSFHVSTSNVILEVIHEGMASVSGKKCGRVLVTALHSYGTPFIRYDIGDIANLDDRCLCGHDGPVLSSIYGRDKSLLKHADGRVSVFFPRAKDLAAVAKFREYRMRQVAFDTIVVEIGGRDSLTEQERTGLGDVITAHAGPGFKVEINPVTEIDWGSNTKRLGFKSEV